MYSTRRGARKCAKELNRALERDGIQLPLHRCQAVIANAGDFRNWRDLETTLPKGPRSIEPAAFRKGLLSALPPCCRPSALFWLDRSPSNPDFDEDLAHWYRYANPYISAIGAIHRRTPQLRIGSGKGQRMRESIVFGLLTQMHGTDKPQLDADTLDVICPGDIEMLFREDFDHPRFLIEIETLTAAGIISVTANAVRIHAFDIEAVEAHVVSSRNGMVEYWASSGLAAVEEVTDAFAAIGAPNAREIAEALAARVDPEGAASPELILDLLADLAVEGRLHTFAEAFNVLKSSRSRIADFVRSSVPAIIAGEYFVRHLGLKSIQITAWKARNPAWTSRLKNALDMPDRFALEVDRMTEAMARS